MSIYKTPKSNFIIHGEGQILYSEDQSKTKMPSLTISIQHVMVVLAYAMKQEIKLKCLWIGKEEVNFF